MNFLIADTFTDSLARLAGDEQKAVKMAAFDLQVNPAHPSHSFHKLDKARDKNFWSVRVSRDIRIIVHKAFGALLLCYVDHHDQAYAWAERRKLEVHPTTGAAQMVEIREKVQELFVPTHTPAVLQAKEKRPALAHVAREELMEYGVPAEWANDVLAADEDELLGLVDHLPAEAAEALLELATGGRPKERRQPDLAFRRADATVLAARDPDLPIPLARSSFEHPDAKRRFRVVTNMEELERALEFPWDKWTVFLHPQQRELIERTHSGPARVAGSAGTGKTIVALHRAVYLARANPDARVLLTTFSETLASALRTKLRRLVSNEPRLGERIDVYAIDAVGVRLYEKLLGPLKRADVAHCHRLIRDIAISPAEQRFAPAFLRAEWDHVVDAWQLDSWEAYRDVTRLGRRTRLPEAQRKVLWSIYERLQARLKEQGTLTTSAMFTKLAKALASTKNPPFDFVVVDEAQDLGVAHLRFLAALGKHRPDALFFAGDSGQRIFQQPISWKALGIDIRGRSRILKVNYRTSHQIRTQADRLLAPVVTDADGNAEERAGTVSVFNGETPEVQTFESEAGEIAAVADWLRNLRAQGLAPHEFGVFVRSESELPRARSAIEAAGLPMKVLDSTVETTSGFVSLATMHQAKGLEFRAVAVMACDDEVLPSQARIETVGDDGDLQEVYETERQLLYVACTRARDYLLVTSTEPSSEFLVDMEKG